LLLNAHVARRNTFESANPLQSFTTPEGLVGQHSTYCTLEDLGWSTVMEWASSRVDITPLTEEAKKLQLVPKMTKTALMDLKETTNIIMLE
jgi:hypothetical protein